jgi:hypothetical protein
MPALHRRRYVWADGNEYDGEWRRGRMHGQGTFVWRSGERYDGEWKVRLGHASSTGCLTWSSTARLLPHTHCACNSFIELWLSRLHPGIAACMCLNCLDIASPDDVHLA